MVISQSSNKTGLPHIDWIVGLDPGYRTQGLCVLDRHGKVHRVFASVTGANTGIHERVMWQAMQATSLFQQFPGHMLLVLEEYAASQSSKASATATYYRGWYDGIFRQQVAPFAAQAISVHNSAVHHWSEPERKHSRVNGLKKRVLPTADKILSYLRLKNEWLDVDFDAMYYQLALRCRGVDGKLDSVESKKASRMHAVDALVMAVMGLCGVVNPQLMRGKTPQQQKWALDVQESYEFSLPTPAGCR